MIATIHKMLPPLELARVARRLKIPVKHVVEYHRWLRGHETTKLDAATKRYIREKMSVIKFRAMDDAVGLKRKSENLSSNQ